MDENENEGENEDIDDEAGAGAAEAVPPRGPDAPVHDLARHLFPSLKVQRGHPSFNLQVTIIIKTTIITIMTGPGLPPWRTLIFP